MHKAAYELCISYWSSDLCAADLQPGDRLAARQARDRFARSVGELLQREQHDATVQIRRALNMRIETRRLDTELARPGGHGDVIEAARVDRTHLVWGKSVPVRVDLGGRGLL